MYTKPDNPQPFFFKRKLCSGLENAWGLSALLILILARFDIVLAIYCNSVRFEFHLFIDSDLWQFYAWKII